MKIRSAIAIVCGAAALLLISRGVRATPAITTPTFLAMQRWVDAVRTHTPGQADKAVAMVSGLSLDTRKDMDAGMALFMTALNPNNKVPMDMTSEPQRLLVDLAHLASGNPDEQNFLVRAAILHSDAAMFGGYVAQAARSGESTSPPLQNDSRDHPLLTHNPLFLDKDGQILGSTVASWNWPFARWLVDYLLKDTGPHPFTAPWYHATTAYMFAVGYYGEATPHVQRAGEVLPDEARILFDRACYAEILGLPMHQVLLTEQNEAQRALNRADGVGTRRTAPAATRGIPLAGVTNATAERLFRQTLRVDPSYVEARVRLARLLNLRGRHEEAAAELATALAAKPAAIVAFYAHLFAGRAAQALRRHEEAARHYADANALFPDAQSALLGSSQVALIGSDVDGTLAPLNRLGDRSTAFTADPWWRYHFAAGRDADALLEAVWASVPR